eukprot:CAMPEP_0119311724 /NCGR_PEP_ID=MMETSP1333-20130426/23668_1 /TAXON_ID=418940 /ORGANISM="Scyphosphaera apsteinii, Strain RCC1455" /LENGTH=40 /DNA_ID= /DNA_START= /DNA_END= /DNA_ORIENTATION=
MIRIGQGLPTLAALRYRGGLKGSAMDYAKLGARFATTDDD